MSSSSEHIKEMRLDRSIVDKKEMRCRIYVNVKEINTKIKCYFEPKMSIKARILYGRLHKTNFKQIYHGYGTQLAEG